MPRTRAERDKDLRARRKAGGLCPCGRAKAPGRDSCAECQAESRRYHIDAAARCVVAYGGRCVGCGEAEIAVLRTVAESGASRLPLAWKLVKDGFPPGYRVLCANCKARAARGLPFPAKAADTRDLVDALLTQLADIRYTEWPSIGLGIGVESERLDELLEWGERVYRRAKKAAKAEANRNPGA